MDADVAVDGETALDVEFEDDAQVEVEFDLEVEANEGSRWPNHSSKMSRLFAGKPRLPSFSAFQQIEAVSADGFKWRAATPVTGHKRLQTATTLIRLVAVLWSRTTVKNASKQSK